MKAPISHRVKEILADKISADKLISSVVKKNKSVSNVITLKGKHYQLQKIAETHKH